MLLTATILVHRLTLAKRNQPPMFPPWPDLPQLQSDRLAQIAYWHTGPNRLDDKM
jgi:hypothetical protein